MPFPPRGEIYHIDWREDRKKSQGAKKLFDPSKNEFVNVSASSSVSSSSSASAFISKKRTKSSHKQKSKPSTIMKRYERRGGSIQDEKSKHGAGAKEVSSKNTRAKYGKRQDKKKKNIKEKSTTTKSKENNKKGDSSSAASSRKKQPSKQKKKKKYKNKTTMSDTKKSTLGDTAAALVEEFPHDASFPHCFPSRISNHGHISTAKS